MAGSKSQLADCSSQMLLSQPCKTKTTPLAALTGVACRLSVCACVSQVTGKNPIAALQEHLSDPWSTTIFSKAVVVPGQAVQPPCKIPQYTEFQGVKSESQNSKKQNKTKVVLENVYAKLVW